MAGTAVCYSGSVTAPVAPPPASYSFTVEGSGQANIAWDSAGVVGLNIEITDSFGNILVAATKLPASGSRFFTVAPDALGSTHTLKVSTFGPVGTAPITAALTINCPVAAPTPTPTPTPTPHPTPHPTPQPTDSNSTVLIAAAVGGGLLAAALYVVSRRR